MQLATRASLSTRSAEGAGRWGPPPQPPKLLHVSIGGPILRSYFAGQLAYMRARGFEVVLAAPGGSDPEWLCRAEGARGHDGPCATL